MATATPRPRSPAVKLTALCCTALLLSCTTVQTHVSAIPGDVDVDTGRLEPQVELWVESNRKLEAKEEEQYRADVRRALDQALAGRNQPEGDVLLLVRAQGVTRTPGRRSDQHAAVAGIVVGAVVIVAAVVIVIVAGSHGGGHGDGGKRIASAAAPSPSRAVATPRPSGPPPRFVVPPARSRPPPVPAIAPPRPGPAHPAPPRPGPPPFRPRPIPPPAPIPWRFHDHHYGAVELGVDVWWALPLEPEPPLYAVPAPPPEEPAAGEAPPPASAAEEEPAAAPEGPPSRFWIAPPMPLPVQDRGFFDGDRLRVEALMIDRHSGAVLWTKQVSRDADPRDPGAVRRAIDELLRDGGWQPPEPPAAPAN